MYTTAFLALAIGGSPLPQSTLPGPLPQSTLPTGCPCGCVGGTCTCADCPIHKLTLAPVQTDPNVAARLQALEARVMALERITGEIQPPKLMPVPVGYQAATQTASYSSFAASDGGSCAGGSCGTGVGRVGPIRRIFRR